MKKKLSTKRIVLAGLFGSGPSDAFHYSASPQHRAKTSANAYSSIIGWICDGMACRTRCRTHFTPL